MLVPHHAVYYTGYPVLAYGSCNKFTATHMQELLCGLVETWTSSERLMARGCIVGVGTDADSRRVLAQQLSIPLGFKMELLLVGVDANMAPWGGTIYDPSHLLKRVRTLVLLHGMVLELGHPINGETLRVLGNAARVQFPNQSMFNPKDKQHVEYALQLLRCVTRVGVALQSNEDVANVLARVQPDLILLGCIFDGLCHGYFGAENSLTTTLLFLGTSALLLMFNYNKFGTNFITTTLYVHLQYSFQGVLYVTWWMQMNTPEASFYVTLLGSQPNEDLYSLLRCMEHNRNFDMAQLMTRLRIIMSVMKVFEDNPEWKQTRTRYLLGRLKPPGFKGDCKVKNIKLGAVWRQCINEAEKILAIHPNIGTQGSIGIFDQLFSEGATLLKPKGRSLQKEVDEEKDVSLVVEEVPETAVRGNSTFEVPEGHVWESFLQIADGPDRSAAYVKLNDGSTVHMAPYINKVFNSNLEHDSTERLRRVRGEGRCPGPRVAPPPADAVVPGTPFATLVTYNSPSKGKCTSAGVFSLLKCTVEGTTIAHLSAMGLKHTQGAKLSG